MISITGRKIYRGKTSKNLDYSNIEMYNKYIFGKCRRMILRQCCCSKTSNRKGLTSFEMMRRKRVWVNAQTKRLKAQYR